MRKAFLSFESDSSKLRRSSGRDVVETLQAALRDSPIKDPKTLAYPPQSASDYQQIITKLDGVSKVVFVGGISAALEGEEMPVEIEGFKGGDRTSIELPRVQRDFLKALNEAGKQVIFVN